MSELDDLVLQTRFDEIHQARERVTETGRVLSQARRTSRINEKNAALMYRDAVKNYILELQNLMRNADDLEKNYWETVEIGAFKLPDGSVKTLHGLQSVLDEPDTWAVTYEESVQKPRQGDTTSTTTEEVYVPYRVIEKAWQRCEEFCDDFGLELEAADVDNQPWQFRKIVDEDDQTFDPQEGPA